MKFTIEDINKKATGIYKITNTINNKFYIGSTSTNFYKRYGQHISDYTKGKNSIPVLYKAFDKYGIDKFIFELIEVCEKCECITREQVYLDLGTDYNCSPTAGSMLGYKHPETAKTKLIIGELHHTSKEVFQFTLDGVFIKRFGSIIDALKDCNKKHGSTSHITNCCTGKTYSCFGFKWSFTNELINRIDKRSLPFSEDRINKMSKPRTKEFKTKGIIAENISTGEILNFKSIKDASLVLDIHQNSIRNNLSGLSTITKSKLNNNKYKFIWDIDITTT